MPARVTEEPVAEERPIRFLADVDPVDEVAQDESCSRGADHAHITNKTTGIGSRQQEIAHLDFVADIGLRRGKAELPPVKAAETLTAGEDTVEPLSRIIEDLNDRFGTDFSDQDKDSLAQLEARLDEEPALKASIEVNVPENARLTFDHVARDKFQDMIESNFKLYKQVTENEDFAGLLFQWLFDRYRRRVGA
jgi:hypothetical protein